MPRGYGVRATEPAPRGSFLLEYAGEIIDEPELAKRMEAARVAATTKCRIERGMFVYKMRA
eukprot:1141157-Pelagomonas_calceolata.AAC.8